MKLVQILLPLCDNIGKRFPARMYATERVRLPSEREIAAASV